MSLNILASFASLIHEGRSDLDSALESAPSMPLRNDENRHSSGYSAASRRGPHHANVLTNSNHRYFAQPHHRSYENNSSRPSFSYPASALGRSPRKVSMGYPDYQNSSPLPANKAKSQVSSAIKRAVLPRRHSLMEKPQQRYNTNNNDQENSVSRHLVPSSYPPEDSTRGSSNWSSTTHRNKPLTRGEYEIILDWQSQHTRDWMSLVQQLPGRNKAFIKQAVGYINSKQSPRSYSASTTHYPVVRQPIPSSSSDDTNKKRVHRKKRVHDLLGDGNKRRKKNNRWSTEEDDRLRHCVMYHGIDSNKWTKISADIPGRNNKQCQERWCNHLDESVNKGPITGGERQILAAIYEENNEFPKTMSFVNLLPGRTAIFARNNWHNMLRKKAKAVNGPTGGASSSSSDSSQAAA